MTSGLESTKYKFPVIKGNVFANKGSASQTFYRHLNARNQVIYYIYDLYYEKI